MRDGKIIIAGGGLAGLVASIHLTRSGVPCTVIEKKAYPFHRVCGEYISNEVVPYLRALGAYPDHLAPAQITRFQLSSVDGKTAYLPLDLGGFGISRFSFDHFLFQHAKKMGVEFILDTEVESIRFTDGQFQLNTIAENFETSVVIGSFGKRSKLDVVMNRSFIQKRSPYVGVKYHIRMTDLPSDLISLHNFENGYCGISHIENGMINLCYLTRRSNLRAHGTIDAMEKAVLFRNPHLREIFRHAEFLFEKPETINEISFETKAPVEQHILMAGDAAGMISPLCGNGMAIAIHSAKILSEHVLRFWNNNNYSRAQLELDYSKAWRSQFALRLWAGRQIQKLFGGDTASNVAVSLANDVRAVANLLMRQTHGKPF
jgi:flavin-dependent dehydrogenase